jgi:hypothetical protein
MKISAFLAFFSLPRLRLAEMPIFLTVGENLKNDSLAATPIKCLHTNFFNKLGQLQELHSQLLSFEILTVQNTK